MAEQSCCQATDCANPVHARGYCRRHYGRIWRREKRGAGGNAEDREKRDRLRALERELLRARQMYDVVVGTPGRIKWRREMDAVKVEILKLDASYFNDGRPQTASL